MMYYDDDVDHSYAKDAPMGAARTLGVTRHPPPSCWLSANNNI